MSDTVIAKIEIVPIGTNSTSLSRYIKSSIEAVKQAKDVTYQVTAMGTLIQGPMWRVMEIAKAMHESPFTMGAQRVLTTITIDDRRDKEITLESKVRAVS